MKEGVNTINNQKVVTTAEKIYTQGNLHMAQRLRYFGKSSQLVIKYIMGKLRKYHGEFFESNSTISKAVGVSVRTVQNAIKRAEQLEIFIVFTRFEETLDGKMRQTTNKIMLLPYNVKKVVRKKAVETIRKVKSMLVEKTQRVTTLPKQQPKKAKNNFKKIRVEHIPEWFSPVEYPTGETDRIYTDKDIEELKRQMKELRGD